MDGFEIFQVIRESAAGVNTSNFVAAAGPEPLKRPGTFWLKSRFASTNLEKMHPMDQKDKDLLNEIQSDFPLSLRPYKEVGDRLQMSERDVIRRIRRLKESGIIRRIGGNFQSSRLNFTSTLCAAKVPEEKIKQFVEVVNRYPGVTHNYLRNHNYNIWFTFIAQDMDDIDKALTDISEVTGVTEIRNLPAVRMFKIRVDFEI